MSHVGWSPLLREAIKHLLYCPRANKKTIRRPPAFKLEVLEWLHRLQASVTVSSNKVIILLLKNIRNYNCG